MRMHNFAQNQTTCTELTKRHRDCKNFIRFCSTILLLLRRWRLPQPAQSITV